MNILHFFVEVLNLIFGLIDEAYETLYIIFGNDIIEKMLENEGNRWVCKNLFRI